MPRKKKSTINRQKKPTTKKPRKTQAEKISEIPYTDIEKITDVKKLEKMFSTLRTGYTRRKKSLEKEFKFIPAVAGIEKYRDVYHDTMRKFRVAFDKEYNKIADTIPNADSMRESIYAAKLRSQINQYQQFFRNKTSTREGILKWQENQDKFIFGYDQNGKPYNTLSEDMRIKFWSVYNEYMKNNNTKNLDSAQVIQLLEKLYYDNANFDLLATMIDRVNAKYEVIENHTYINKLYNDYLNENIGDIYDDMDYIHKVDNNIIENAVNDIAEHFPLYNGDIDTLKDEIRNNILKGEYTSSGSAIYSKRWDSRQ